MCESKCAHEKILPHLESRKIRGLKKRLLCTLDRPTDLQMQWGGAELELCVWEVVLLSGLSTRATQLPMLMGGN